MVRPRISRHRLLPQHHRTQLFLTLHRLGGQSASILIVVTHPYKFVIQAS